MIGQSNFERPDRRQVEDRQAIVSDHDRIAVAKPEPSFAVASVSTPGRPLPTRSISVGLLLCVTITGLAANINLARGREKRTNVRPVSIAVKATKERREHDVR